jgi:hypothetical protein
MNNFKQTQPPPQAPVIAQDHRQYLHTYTVGAGLPFIQASITALLTFVGTLCIDYFVLDLIDPHKPAILVAVIVWIWTWIARQRWWITLIAERITGIDINHDGVVGSTTKEPEIIRVQLREVKANGSVTAGDNIDLPLSREQMESLSRGMLNGVPFSERKWTAPNSDVFSSNEFRTLRSIMIKRQLIELINEKDARQGYKLTAQGRAIMEYYASPTPSDDGLIEGEE